MKFLFWVLFLVCIAPKPGSCTMEIIHAPHKVSLWADARPYFGEVSATLEATPNKEDKRLSMKSIVLFVQGKRFVVPKEDLKEMRFPQLNSAIFVSGSSQETRAPYLYLEFNLHPATAEDAEHKKVRIWFSQGKIGPISIFNIKGHS